MPVSGNIRTVAKKVLIYHLDNVDNMFRVPQVNILYVCLKM